MGPTKRRTWNRSARLNRPRRGFSLIEIMVVLVILLIGILAVVRLFPPGFLTIARTAEQTIAEGLGQAQLDVYKNMPVVPQSIVPIDLATGNIDSKVAPDDLLDFTLGDTRLAGLDPYYFSNANRSSTRIIGETFHISVPTSNSGRGQGAIYMLQFGPVRNVFGTDGLGNPSDSLTVRGIPLERTIQSPAQSLNSPTGIPNITDDAQYAIYYAGNGGTDPVIAFYPRAGAGARKFSVTYDYYGKDAGGNVVINSPAAAITLIVPDVAPGANVIPVWQHIFSNGAGLPANQPGYLSDTATPTDIVTFHAESEDVSRKFVLKVATPVVDGGLPNFSNNDPYEYAWFSRQFATNANAGVLIFNPSGYDELSQAARGNQALTARVDYTLFDNHILRDDRTVPSSAPYSVRLSIPFDYANGDVLDINASFNNYDKKLNPYNGMFRDPAVNTPDLLIYNANTGEEVGSWITGAGGAGALFAGPSNPVPFDPKTGILTLNKAYVETAATNLQSGSLRCLYRAHKDWAMQMQKASSYYTPTDTLATVDYKHYFVSPAGSPSPTRVYFAPCDAGKTVVIGQYYDLSNGSTPINNEAYQIVSDPAQFDGANLPYIDTTTVHPTFTGFSYIQTGRYLNNVQGGSMKSRVLWRSGSRWRRADTETFLYQSQIR